MRKRVQFTKSERELIERYVRLGVATVQEARDNMDEPHERQHYTDEDRARADAEVAAARGIRARVVLWAKP